MNASRRRPSRHVRRGNTMILVAGILVLLAILAATFITRAQGVRVTGTASQQLATSTNAVELIKNDLANEVTIPLFAWPVDTNFPLAGMVADANAPRIPPAPDAIRYGIDPQDFLINATGVAGSDGLPDHPYARAPFVVSPWTNWPDIVQAPAGDAGLGVPGLGEGNPFGSPGYGDTRWLRDSEPLRWPVDSSQPNAFLYYPHFTNLSRPNNGYRIVKDISDVTDLDGNGLGGLVNDLNLPVEQWLRSVRPDAAMFNAFTGDSILDVDFINRWDFWFDEYWNAYSVPTNIPPNFYHLKDLNGDGVYLGPGETPRDEFRVGSLRWNVGRVLADADGDGFTDSFWHLAPTPIERGIRHLVAISVVDNNGQVNGNTGSQFDPLTTAGETPADIALVGDWINSGPSYHVGLFDNWESWRNTDQAWELDPRWDWPSLAGLPFGGSTTQWVNGNLRWPDYMGQLTIDDGNGQVNTADGNVLLDPYLRRLYWQNAGLRPFNAGSGLTPFTLADEIELRMYHGSNYPWILSRFERAVGTSNGGLLRQATGIEETNAYKDQLNNPELLHDTRHRLTLFNGARNEELAPWLRRETRNWLTQNVIGSGLFPLWLPQVISDAVVSNPIPEDFNGNGVDDIIDRYVLQQRTKLDLREARPNLGFSTPANLHNRGVLRLHERLAEAFLLALTDGDQTGGDSYVGTYAASSEQLEVLRRIAAGWAANVLAYRDADAVATLNTTADPALLPLENNLQILPQVGAVPLPEIGTLPADDTTRMLGMERQPFLLEAFIAHVHEATPLPPNPDPTQFENLYQHLANHVHSGPDLEQKTIVVVQIANPFDRPIPLETLQRYRISVFGKDLDLSQIPTLEALPPATEDRPATAIFAMIPTTFDHGGLGTVTDFRTQWADFLDLGYTQGGIDHHPAETQFYFLESGDAAVNWDDERRWYDGWNVQNENAIELRRLDLSAGVAQPQLVVVDRFDYDEDDPEHDAFRDRVQDHEPPPGDLAPLWRPAESLKPGIRVGDNDFFVAWTRVTRAWGFDFDYAAGDPLFEGIQPRERAPRYVFASEGVFPSAAQSATLFDGDTYTDAGEANRYEGGAYEGGQVPETPWFTYQYKLAPGVIPVITRKPTLFDGFSNEVPGVSGVIDGTGQIVYGVDKCFYGEAANDAISDPYRDSLQMLQKDADFQQIGELLNVWLLGHELEFDNAGLYVKTERTFSEWMRLIQSSASATIQMPNVLDFPAGRTRHVNRLDPGGGGVVGVGDPASPRDPLHAVPALPAGLRALDAFVCDGPGLEYNPQTDVFQFQDFAFGNAAFYQGRATPGLININTASQEVLDTLPHWYRLVHRAAGTNNDVITPTGADGWGQTHPKTAISKAAISYRERYDNQTFGYPSGPDYSLRPANVRGERGFASISELRLLDLPGTAVIPYPSVLGSPQGWTDVVPDAWRISFAGDEPFEQVSSLVPPEGAAFISTDVVPSYQRTPSFVDDDQAGGIRADARSGDLVARDAEEANLLFAGASNLVTTRSDVFTIYFKVRSFKQSENGAWDATNPEAIVDEGRYVMLIDRSQVNRPTDKPRILYFEKLPN